MSWLSNIFSKLGFGGGNDAERVVEQLEHIRATMLDTLGDDGAKKYPLVVKRVFHSKDAQALWYARGELMAALADLHGERVAHELVSELSTMFEGLLPKSLMPRRTHLKG